MAAVLCFAGLDTSAKWLNQRIPPLETIWFRFVASVLFVVILINPVTRPGVLRSRRPWLQAVRSLLLFGSTLANFTALKYLQLAETTSINFAAPLLVALIAGPLLGEWVGPRRLAAIGVGFAGVLVITRPGLGGLHPAALYVVGGVVCYAFYSILTRLLASHDPPETTMVYSGVAGMLVTTPLVPSIYVDPGLAGWGAVALMGVFGALGHWLIILAHQRAPAPILAPFSYSQIVAMIALGYLVFGDLPDRWTLAGGAIVVASGLYLLWRERVTRGGG